MKFQDKLKELRIKHNETQQDLADFLNITFQSVSKWEKGICLPNIELIKEIATHYNVSLDSLLIDDLKIENVAEENKVNKREYHPTFNKESFFTVYTEGHYRAFYKPDRYRTAVSRPQSAASSKNYYVLAIDNNGKVIYFGYGTGHGYGSPCDYFYHQENMIEVKKLDCFHLLDTYTPYGDGTMHHMDFEFLIPSGGFVITISDNSFEFKSMLELFLNRRINQNMSLMYEVKNIRNGDLDRFTFSLKEDLLVLTFHEQQKDVLKNSMTNIIFQDLFKEFLKTHKKEIIEEIMEDVEDEINEAIDLANEAIDIANEAIDIANEALEKN